MREGAEQHPLKNARSADIRSAAVLRAHGSIDFAISAYHLHVYINLKVGEMECYAAL